MTDPTRLPPSRQPTVRCGTPRASKSSRWRALALIAVHVAVLIHIAHWKVSGRSFTPLEPSEAMQTLELGYVNAGFLLFVFLIVATLVVGRFFCGWACHVVAYQDLCAWLLKKMRIKARPVRSRLLVFIPIGVALYMFAWPQIVRLMEDQARPSWVWHLTTDDFWKTFPGLWIAILTLVVDGFLIVYLLGSKAFCTYGCPYGALFSAAGRFAAGRIRVNDDCEGCGHCTATCSSNVRVHEEVARFGRVVDSGCMKCLDCVSVCPKGALSFGFGGSRKVPAAPRSAGGPRRSYDFSWPEEGLLLLAFLTALYAMRQLYGAVPLLLAVGLAVIIALATIVLLRLLARPDLQFQHHPLKQSGRLTGAGIVGGIAAAGLLLFTAHSAVVQYHLHEGERLFAAAQRLERDARQPSLSQSLDHLRTAERWGLCSHEQLEGLLAGNLRFQGDYAGAAVHLERAIEHAEDVPKILELSTLYMHLGRREDARSALHRVLTLEPEEPRALERLKILERDQRKRDE